MPTPLTTATATLKAGSEAFISGCQCEYEGGASIVRVDKAVTPGVVPPPVIVASRPLPQGVGLEVGLRRLLGQYRRGSDDGATAKHTT